jgi:hypothetical protein
MYAPNRIRAHDPSFRVVEDNIRPSPRDHCDRHKLYVMYTVQRKKLLTYF